MILVDAEQLENEAGEIGGRLDVKPEIELTNTIESIMQGRAENKYLAYTNILRLLVRRLDTAEFEKFLGDIRLVSALKWIGSRDYGIINAAAGVIKDSIFVDDPRNVTYQLRFRRLQKLDFFRVTEN